MKKLADPSFDKTIHSLFEIEEEDETTHGMMRRRATESAFKKALDSVEMAAVSPLRAREILRLAEKNQDPFAMSAGVMSLGEIAAVRLRWSSMSADSTMLDAVRAIADEEDEYEATDVNREVFVDSDEADPFAVTHPRIPAKKDAAADITVRSHLAESVEVAPAVVPPRKPTALEEAATLDHRSLGRTETDQERVAALKLEIRRLRTALSRIARAPEYEGGARLREMARESLVDEPD